jgi:hypothetical protein
MKNKIVILFIGIISSFLPYWFFEFVFPFIGAGVLLGSLILTLILNEKPWKIALLINAGVIMGIMCAVFTDPPNHTLFPFEIIMALVINVPLAFIGSYLLPQLFKFIKSKITIANNS